MKKPDQIVDEISGKIFPPAEAVVNQLTTIRAIIPSTIKMYQSTEDIHTIQPNLDMIQRAIDYLRGAPMRDELKPAPEDTLKPTYIPASAGFTITSTLNKNGEYDVSVLGIDVEPKLNHPELFGDIGINVVELGIEIPVICGESYMVTQSNPVLSYYYPNDSYIVEVDNEGSKEYIKQKDYLMNEDFFQYVFLLKEGRTKVRIEIDSKDEPIVFNITSHIHFKKQELPEEPPIIEEPETGEGENNNDVE